MLSSHDTENSPTNCPACIETTCPIGALSSKIRWVMPRHSPSRRLPPRSVLMPKAELCSAVASQRRRIAIFVVLLVALTIFAAQTQAQMIDNTQALNPINAGINKSLAQEVGTRSEERRVGKECRS